MHAACRSPDVAKAGSHAVYNLAYSNSETKAKLVAAGAREVLQAIVADSLSSTDAKNKAKDAIGQLRQGLFGLW